MVQPSVLNKATTPSETARTSPVLSHIPGPAVAGYKRKRVAEKKYYAVKEGRTPGVYETWDECRDQVRGQKGAVFRAFPSLHEAQAFVAGALLTPSLSAKQSSEQKFYAVSRGTRPGVYTDWDSALKQIRGYKNPKYRRFYSRAEAEQFVAQGRKGLNGGGKNGVPKQYGDMSGEGDPDRWKALIDNSAPGMILNGNMPTKDREGKEIELGRGPLPPGSEDGFDPNIRLADDGSSTLVQKTAAEKRMTKQITVEKDPPAMLRIYTDGSSLKNGQAGSRAGVGVYFGPGDTKNVSEALKGTKQTNQRAELTAILRALEIAPRHRDVTIYTDSRYAIDCVTNWYKTWVANKWLSSKGKPVENKDLVQEVREKIEIRDRVGKKTYFVWIKGHANDEGNVAADRLAVEGAMMGNAPERPEGETQQVEEPTHTTKPEENAEDEERAEAFKAMDEAMDDDDDDEDDDEDEDDDSVGVKSEGRQSD